MKILCIGHTAYDTTFPVEAFPDENTKNRVPEKIECGGGPASNGAYLLGKWGMEVYIASVIGNDEYGHRLIKEFESVNVNLDYLEVNDEVMTTNSIIISNTSNGSRTILTYRPSTIKMKDIELDFSPDVILMDGQEYELSKKILQKYPNAISIIDAGRDTDEIIELAKMVTYVVASKEFAESVTGITLDYNYNDSIASLYNKMKEIFKTNIVVTLEAKGALYEFENEIKIMPSVKVKPIDSTGAGDIFHGAFTYGIANGLPFETVIKGANVAGALSVTRLGGRYSIFNKEDITKYVKEFK